MKTLLMKVRNRYKETSTEAFIKLLGINSSMYYDIKKGKRKYVKKVLKDNKLNLGEL